MEKQYWFYIDSFVHISLKGDAVLFYNPYTGKILQYDGQREITGLVKRLQAPSNLRVIKLKERDLAEPVIGEFVRAIRAHFMGDLLDTAISRGKPAQMPPIVKIHKDETYLKADKNRSIGENIINYLSDVTLYVNDWCGFSCDFCGGAYRQFPCCTSVKKGDGKRNKERNNELPLSVIRRFLNETENCPLLNLHISGGDIFSYSSFDDLVEFLASREKPVYFHLHYLNAAENIAKLDSLARWGQLKITLSLPAVKDGLADVVDAVRANEGNVCFNFIVGSEGEFEAAGQLVSQLGIGNHDFLAFYNGNNLDFFQENLFLEQEEIEGVRPSLKDIYSRGVINGSKFGKLTVFPDRRVVADTNSPQLGRLGRDSIYDILSKELAHRKSWRQTRQYVSPCKSCTFQFLCPPLSGYNHVVGRNDLCHIRSREKMNPGQTFLVMDNYAFPVGA